MKKWILITIIAFLFLYTVITSPTNSHVEGFHREYFQSCYYSLNGKLVCSPDPFWYVGWNQNAVNQPRFIGLNCKG